MTAPRPDAVTLVVALCAGLCVGCVALVVWMERFM